MFLGKSADRDERDYVTVVTAVNIVNVLTEEGVTGKAVTVGLRDCRKDLKTVRLLT